MPDETPWGPRTLRVKRRKFWDKARIADLKAGYSSGLNMAQLAATLHVTRRDLRNRCYLLGLRGDPKHNSWKNVAGNEIVRRRALRKGNSAGPPT